MKIRQGYEELIDWAKRRRVDTKWNTVELDGREHHQPLWQATPIGKHVTTFRDELALSSDQ